MGGFNNLGGLIFLACYFAPAICAAIIKNPRWPAVLVLNLLTGWTVIGWIVCFIWGCSKPSNNKQTVTIIQQFGDASEVDARGKGHIGNGRRLVTRGPGEWRTVDEGR